MFQLVVLLLRSNENRFFSRVMSQFSFHLVFQFALNIFSAIDSFAIRYLVTLSLSVINKKEL